MRNVNLYSSGSRRRIGQQAFDQIGVNRTIPFALKTPNSALASFGADMFRALTAKAEKDKEEKIRTDMLAAMLGDKYQYDPNKASESFTPSPYMESQRAALADAQAQAQPEGVSALGLGSDSSALMPSLQSMPLTDFEPENIEALMAQAPSSGISSEALEPDFNSTDFTRQPNLGDAGAMQAALIGDIKTPLGYAGDRGGLPASTEELELAAYAGSPEEMAAQESAYRATVNTPDAVAARMAEAVRLNPDIAKDPAYAQFVQSHVAEQQRLRAESTARDRAVDVRDEERLYDEKISDIENQRKIAAALVKQQGEETIEGLKPRSSSSGLTKSNAPYKRLRKDGTPGLFQMQQQSDGTWLEKDLGDPLEDQLEFGDMTSAQLNTHSQIELETEIASLKKEDPTNPAIKELENRLKTLKENINKAPNVKQQGKFAETVGKKLAETAVDDYILARGTTQKVAKIDDLIDRLNATDGSNFGFLAEAKLAGRKLLALFGSEEQFEKISGVEMIAMLQDSDVFPLITSLGIGARGLDTPAERNFLRDVMTGRITLTKETLLLMAHQRRNIQTEIAKDWNRQLEEGTVGQYRKVDVPPAKNVPRKKGARRQFDKQGKLVR
mgnify:CR=1 FL=1|jgi:hypothetical protein